MQQISTPVRFALSIAILVWMATLVAGCQGGIGGGWRGQDGAVAGQDGDPPGADALTSTTPPPQQEICDGFDNDKDGEVDELCQCVPGQTKACYPAPPQTLKGPCKQGAMTCFGKDEFGNWGACSGAVLPLPEICGDGIDQDCTGADLPCPPKCGDSKCNNGETCKTCPQDCGACAPYCGDGSCNTTESCLSCPKDCGACPGTCETFTFAVSARAVDIVWIIDQSGSMSGDIAGVKQNMNAFSSYINGTQIDYHVIVLAHRGTGTYDICIPAPLGGASCGDGPRFKQVDQWVYSNDSLTKLQTHIAAVESFMRPNSLRIFVEVSDDNSSLKAATFDAWLKARAAAYNDYIFHSIVGLTAGGCVAAVGTEYVQLSSSTKGLTFHICSASWNTLFNQLGQQVANIAQTQYKLKHKPLIQTIKVYYNNVLKQLGTDWVYDVQNQQLVLQGTLPGPGAQIKVCYDHLP